MQVAAGPIRYTWLDLLGLAVDRGLQRVEFQHAFCDSRRHTIHNIYTTVCRVRFACVEIPRTQIKPSKRKHDPRRLARDVLLINMHACHRQHFFSFLFLLHSIYARQTHASYLLWRHTWKRMLLYSNNFIRQNRIVLRSHISFYCYLEKRGPWGIALASFKNLWSY